MSNQVVLKNQGEAKLPLDFNNNAAPFILSLAAILSISALNLTREKAPGGISPLLVLVEIVLFALAIGIIPYILLRLRGRRLQWWSIIYFNLLYLVVIFTTSEIILPFAYKLLSLNSYSFYVIELIAGTIWILLAAGQVPMLVRPPKLYPSLGFWIVATLSVSWLATAPFLFFFPLWWLVLIFFAFLPLLFFYKRRSKPLSAYFRSLLVFVILSSWLISFLVYTQVILWPF